MSDITTVNVSQPFSQFKSVNLVVEYDGNSPSASVDNGFPIRASLCSKNSTSITSTPQPSSNPQSSSSPQPSQSIKESYPLFDMQTIYPLCPAKHHEECIDATRSNLIFNRLYTSQWEKQLMNADDYSILATNIQMCTQGMAQTIDSVISSGTPSDPKVLFAKTIKQTCGFMY